MPHALHLHPSSVCEAINTVDAMFSRQVARLTVRFVLRGKIADVLLPEATLARRVDELWQHTCCEVFLQTSNAAYYEFNFSPATEWAAYRFSGYREGMNVADEIAAPSIEVRRGAFDFELRAVVDLPAAIAAQSRLRIGLAAVVEERVGRKSYWALAHPPDKPDFHHACNFIEMAE